MRIHWTASDFHSMADSGVASSSANCLLLFFLFHPFPSTALSGLVGNIDFFTQYLSLPIVSLNAFDDVSSF